MSIFRGILCFLTIVVLFSCKKETDEIPPTVSIEIPSSSLSINVKDEFRVKGSASDNEALEYVSILLVSYKTGRIIPPSATFYPTSNRFAFDYYFQITDTLIESGDYYIKVEASDGNVRIASSEDIQIQGIPKVFLSAIVATGNNTSTTVKSINQNFLIEDLWNIGNGCKKIIANSYDQQLWFVPSNSNIVRAYNLKENTMELEEPIDVLGLTNPFYDAALFNRKLLLSTKANEVRQLNFNYLNTLLFRASNRVIDRIITNGKQVLLSQSQNDLDAFPKQLISIFSSTGGVQSTINIDKNILGINNLEQNPNTILISDLNSFDTYFYNPSNGSNNIIYTDRNNGFVDAIPVGDFEFILIGNNKVGQYNSQTNLYRNIKQGLVNPVCAYDEVNNHIWIGSASQIEVYDYSTLSLINSRNLGSSVKEITIRYNR